MKKWIWLIVISIVLVSGLTFSYTVNSGTKETISKNNDEFLKLVLQIDGEKIQGEVKSLILHIGNNIFFFGDKGKCVKKIKVTESGPRFIISRNGAYCVIVNYNNDRINPKSSLSLFNSNGLLIWEKEFNNFLTPFGVANDGKRVLAGLVPYDEADYIKLKYLDEKGKELITIDANIEQYDEFRESIPANCRYWICRDTKNNWVYIDSEGKKVKERKEVLGKLRSIADNGNYLMELKKGKVKDSYFFNFQGDIISKYIDCGTVYLSKNGKCIFYVTNEFFIFDNLYKQCQIVKENIDNKTDNRKRVLSNMESNLSYNGELAVIELESVLNNWFLFISNKGEILPIELKTNDFRNGIWHEIIYSRNLIFMVNGTYTKGNLYEMLGDVQ